MNEKPEEQKKAEPSPAQQQPAHKRKRKPRQESIYLIPYPKVVFFYPAFLTAIVLAIWMTLTDRFSVATDDSMAVLLTWIFLGILTLNLIIITFDFPRATSLTIFFFLAAVALGTVLLFTFYPTLLPTVTELLVKIRPVANATFYIVFASVMFLIYVAVFINVRFNYWEVRPNELLHHHGILSDLKRYSAPNLRVDKEINDVFEYLLLHSGRLILQPSSERRAITLENVLFINSKEKAITGMLGALQVQLRRDER
jgi:hypothetical protein